MTRTESRPAIARKRNLRPAAGRGARRGFQLLSAVAPGLAARLALAGFRTPQRKYGDTPAWPEGARSLVIKHGRARLQGYAWGSGGPTVLLVHGWESHAGRLQSFVAPLLERGFGVLAFDAPAHGRSPGKRTDLPDYAAAIGAAIAQHGPVRGVIAHSFGAAATLWLLAQRPDLPGDPLAGVGVATLGSPVAVGEMLRGAIEYVGASPAVAKRMRDLFQRRFGHPVEHFSLTGVAGALNARGLIIHDRDDLIVPFAAGQALAQAWPAADFVATSGLGHRKLLLDPTVIGRVLEFI